VKAARPSDIPPNGGISEGLFVSTKVGLSEAFPAFADSRDSVIV